MKNKRLYLIAFILLVMVITNPGFTTVNEKLGTPVAGFKIQRRNYMLYSIYDQSATINGQPTMHLKYIGVFGMLLVIGHSTDAAQ